MDNDGNKLIPSGKTLDEILLKLFTRVTLYMPSITYEWPNSITKNPSVAISLSQGGSKITSNQNVEAGTLIYFNGASGNVDGSTYGVYSTGCTNGYKKGDNGTYNSGNYNKVYNMQVGGDYQLSVSSIQGFKTASDGLSAVTIANPNANESIPASVNAMYVNDGNNSLTVSQTGKVYSPADSSSFETFKLYSASNVKTYDNAYSVDVVYDSYENVSSVTANGSATTPVIKGYRKYFYGLLDNVTSASNITSAVIRNLTGSTAAANGNEWTLPIVAGKAQCVIAVPKSEYNTIEVFQVSINDYIQDVPEAQKFEVQVEGANGYKPVTYVCWTYSTAAGSYPAADTYKIRFKNV